MRGSTRTWVLLLAGLAAVCLVSIAAIELLRPAAVTAEIYQAGELIRTVDLTGVAEPYSFALTAPDGGSNTVQVEQGRIRVSHADCPDQVCVRQGWVSDGVVPIVCLPHQLVIQIRGEDGEVDAATG